MSMQRVVLKSLVVCLLVLSSSLLVANAEARTVHPSAGQATVTPSPISLERLTTLVRQALGQQAVDDLGQRITQPLSTHASPTPSISLPQPRTSTASRAQANVQEHDETSSSQAGYVTDAYGVSWVQGVVGYFNVVSPALPAVGVVTAIAVGSPSAEIDLGVEQTQGYAYLTFRGGISWALFQVQAGDQMDALIYLDGSTNQWLLFIEDLTTRTSFGEEFSYITTTFLVAGWVTQVNSGGPVPSMFPITFTNAEWLSNWAGWQPIISSAAAAYYQESELAPNGGQIWPTEIPDPPGTLFSLLSCSTC